MKLLDDDEEADEIYNRGFPQSINGQNLKDPTFGAIGCQQRTEVNLVAESDLSLRVSIESKKDMKWKKSHLLLGRSNYE